MALVNFIIPENKLELLESGSGKYSVNHVIDLRDLLPELKSRIIVENTILS